LLPHVSEVLLHIRNTNITSGVLRHCHMFNRATEADWGVYSWPWQSFWGKMTVPCVWPETDAFQLQTYWADVQSFIENVN